jgi:hypothetical protein
MTFESGSRLERIEATVFSKSGLKSIEIRGIVTFIDGSVFLGTPVEEDAREEELNAQNR